MGSPVKEKQVHTAGSLETLERWSEAGAYLAQGQVERARQRAENIDVFKYLIRGQNSLSQNVFEGAQQQVRRNR